MVVSGGQRGLAPKSFPELVIGVRAGAHVLVHLGAEGAGAEGLVRQAYAMPVLGGDGDRCELPKEKGRGRADEEEEGGGEGTSALRRKGCTA
jgi:hypothetical protein